MKSDQMFNYLWFCNANSSYIISVRRERPEWTHVAPAPAPARNESLGQNTSWTRSPQNLISSFSVSQHQRNASTRESRTYILQTRSEPLSQINKICIYTLYNNQSPVITMRINRRNLSFPLRHVASSATVSSWLNNSSLWFWHPSPASTTSQPHFTHGGNLRGLS